MNKSVFSVARAEFTHWLFNPRVIIMGILIVFMKNIAIDPILARAVKYGVANNVFEPFVAVGNAAMLMILLPCVFLSLIGDFPRINSNTLLVLHRTGKNSWFFGQILFICYAALAFLAIIFISSALMSGGVFSPNWSDAVTKYNAKFPNEAGNFAASLLPPNLYNQIPLHIAVLQTVSMQFLYMVSLAMILLIFRMLKTGIFSIFAVYAVLTLGLVTMQLNSSLMWVFPVANAVAWRHYEELLAKPVSPIWYSYVYFALFIAAFAVAGKIILKKMQFINMEEL